MNDQPDDRLGLGAFDDVDAPDRWNEIVSRADASIHPTRAAVDDHRRRGPAVWFMSAAAAVLIVVAVVAVAARSGDEVTTPATTPDDTVAPPTDVTAVPTTRPTTPPTTAPGSSPVVPSPTATTATTATTVPPTSPPPTTAPDDSAPASTVPVLNQVEVWDPVCLDQYGDDLPPTIDPGRFDELTTLGPNASLEIVLPSVATSNGPDLPLRSMVQVPGGVLVAIHATARDAAGADVDVTTLAIVELDGTVRWRRCLAGEGSYAGVLVGTDPPTIHVAMNDLETGSSELRAFIAANGFDLGSLPLDGLVVSSTSGGHALATVPWSTTAIEPGAEMALADVTQVRPERIPYPDLAIGRAPDLVRYDLVEVEGELVVAATDSSSVSPDLVFRDGAWSDDPDDLRGLPPTLVIPYGADDPGLQLVDGAGEVVWTVPGFRTISREGFSSAVSDTVALAMRCESWTEDAACGWSGDTPPEERLVAYDLATGDELWSRPGGRAFAAIDHDRAIMLDDFEDDGENDGWRLVDLRTGDELIDEPVSRWTQDGIFLNECCGAGDVVFTSLDGGVLYESAGDRVRVWLPPSVTTPTATVDLSE